MPSKDNKKAETARANTRRIIEQAPKILLGLFAITGVAYLAGSIYTRSYFSEFRASWILDEVPTTVYFSQNWIPLLLILFLGYLATTSLASMENQGKATGTTRFKVSVAVVQYGPWLLVGFLIMIPLLSGLRWIMPAIVLSVAAITYYAVGLVGYAAKGVKALGWPVNVDLAIALSIPLIALAALLGVRHVRKVVSRAANIA